MKIGSFEEVEENVLLNSETISNQNLGKNDDDDGKTLNNASNNNNNENNIKSNDNVGEVKGENVDNVLVDDKVIKSVVKKCESKLVKTSAVDHHETLAHPSSSMPTISVCYAAAAPTIEKKASVEMDKPAEQEEPQQKRPKEPDDEEIVMVLQANAQRKRDSGSQLDEEEEIAMVSNPEEIVRRNSEQKALRSGEQDDDYEMVIEGENFPPGCVPPAPTPAPSIAPLAEIEMDPADDDLDFPVPEPKVADQPPSSQTNQNNCAEMLDDQVKKKKKREKKTGNPVCPWDDE
jgi:hypothetical protein